MNKELIIAESNKANLLIYSILCLFFNLLIWASNFLFISDSLYFNAFAETLSYERIEVILAQARQWNWVTYILFPVLLFIKLSLTTLCLSLGCYFAQNRFSFNLFLNVSLSAEIIFLLPVLIKLLWFLFIHTDYDLNDLSQFYPLSVLNLINVKTIPNYLLYPLQTLNLFEVAYWFLLAHGVADATGFSFKRSFELVMSSYGVGLVLWVVLVMFLTITYS